MRFPSVARSTPAIESLRREAEEMEKAIREMPRTAEVIELPTKVFAAVAGLS